MIWHLLLLFAAALGCGWLLWTRRRGAFLALFGLLALVQTYPLVFHLDRLPANTGATNDAYLFMWSLWWVKTALLRLSNPFFCDALYYPYGTTLVFHGVSLTQSLSSLPLQFVKSGVGGVVLAYNAVVLGSFWIAGYAAYRLAWRVVSDRTAAVLCGIGFAFSNYHFASTVRLHSLSLEWLPIYLLALLGFLERGRVRDGALLGLVAVAVFYASIEYAYYLALATLLFGAGHLLWGERRAWNHGSSLSPFPRPGALAAVALPLVLTLPFWVAFFAEMKLSHTPIAAQAANLSADLLDYALPNPRHPWYGEAVTEVRNALHRHGTPVAMGQSLVVSLLAAAGVVRIVRRRAWRLVPWIATAVVFAAVTLGPELRVGGEATGLPGGFALLGWLPFFEQSRVPVRAVPLVHLSLGILAAYGLHGLRRRLAPGPGWWLAVGAAALVFFETLQVPLRVNPVRVPPAFAQAASGPAEALLDWPPGRGASVEVEGLHQIVHGRPLVQDLPLFLPRASTEARRRAVGPELRRFTAALNELGAERDDARRAELQELRARLGIGYVVLRRRDMTPYEYRRARTLLLWLGPESNYEDAEGFLATFAPGS